MSKKQSLLLKNVYFQSDMKSTRNDIDETQKRDFNSLFCNNKLVQKKNNMVQMIKLKHGQTKKFNNIKAYKSIPLLNNFKKYLSVEVVRENKNSKYDLIFKTQLHKFKDNIEIQRFKTHSCNRKRNFEQQRNEINPQNQYNQGIYQNKHSRLRSEEIQHKFKKRLNYQKSNKRIDIMKVNSLMSKKLINNQKTLTIQGSKINYQKNYTHIKNQSQLSIYKQFKPYTSNDITYKSRQF